MEKEDAVWRHAGQTKRIEAASFDDRGDISVFWLGNAGALINICGTCLMVDPVLEDFALPLLIDYPIKASQVPHLEAVLVTHGDEDHYNVATCRGLGTRHPQFHSTEYVSQLMAEHGIACGGHRPGETFMVKDVKVTVTPADHAWQNIKPEYSYRIFELKDCCGFLIEKDGYRIWLPGDTSMLPDHLRFGYLNLIMTDFSESPWHMGMEGTIRLADRYDIADIIPIHWGCIDTPERPEFCADPYRLKNGVKQPEHVHILAPGERYIGKDR